MIITAILLMIFSSKNNHNIKTAIKGHIRKIGMFCFAENSVKEIDTTLLRLG